MNASEMQQWAINLLAIYTNETHVKLSELGTNIPPRLLTLAPKIGPSVFVHVPENTNSPSFVQLYWGSGFLGAHGIEVGPTNFTGMRGQRLWHPGVYFY